MSIKTVKTVTSLLCKKNGELSVFGEITINNLQRLGRWKKWYYMEQNGFKKSLKHNNHFDDMILLLDILEIKYTLENDAPRGGVGGNHIALSRVNNHIKKRLINIIS